MPGPYTSFLADSSLLSGTVLALVGGYAKADRRPVSDATYQVAAEEFNKSSQATSDIVERLHDRVDVLDFLPVVDGVTDCKAQIDLAVAKAKAAGKALHFGKGRYKISQAIIIEAASGMQIYSDHGAVIVYPSSDATLTASVAYGSDPATRRGALYLRNSTDVTIRGLTFEGDPDETDIAINCGMAITLYKCSRTLVTDVRFLYGGGPITQSNHTEDVGTIVNNFTVYGARHSARLGNASSFKNGAFETPLDDAGYDRVTVDPGTPQEAEHGSSHAIYFFAASGSVCSVENVTFRGTRVDGVKVSGSASPIQSLRVTGCTFDRVGLNADGSGGGGVGIVMGANDIQEHNNLQVSACQFVDCNGGIGILGARAVQIENCQFYTTAAPVDVGSAFISISRYESGSQPAEMVKLSGILIAADPTIGGANISLNGITIANVGEVDGTYNSSVSLSDIDVAWSATTGIKSTGCVAPTFSNIKVTGCVQAINLNGDAYPWIKSLSVVNQQSNNAQIRMTDVSWPIIPPEFYGAGHMGTFTGKVGISDNAGGSSSVSFPLLGVTGFAKPSESRPEIVFAYGADWTPVGTTAIGRCSNDPTDVSGTITLLTAANTENFRLGQRFIASPNSNGSSPRSGTGTVTAVTSTTVTFSGTITGITTNDYLFQAADYIEINGSTITYVTSGATTSQFSSIATLITAIQAIGGGTYTCADYGADYSPTVTTRHLRVRRVATSILPNVFYGRSFTYRPTAGRFLHNYAVLGDRAYARGEDVDKFVIWSPCYKLHAPPVVSPTNAAAQTAMSASYPMRFLPLPDAADPAASCTMTCTGLVGTEEFAWRC